MNQEPPIIDCAFPNEDALYMAYMPYVQGGGLFVRTSKSFELGSIVLLSVQLMTEADNYIIEGKVVWLTPKGAQRNKPVGVGIQFVSDNGRQLSNKIETYLAGMLKSSQTTDTI